MVHETSISITQLLLLLCCTPHFLFPFNIIRINLLFYSTIFIFNKSCNTCPHSYLTKRKLLLIIQWVSYSLIAKVIRLNFCELKCVILLLVCVYREKRLCRVKTFSFLWSYVDTVQYTYDS